MSDADQKSTKNTEEFTSIVFHGVLGLLGNISNDNYFKNLVLLTWRQTDAKYSGC